MSEWTGHLLDPLPPAHLRHQRTPLSDSYWECRCGVSVEYPHETELCGMAVYEALQGTKKDPLVVLTAEHYTEAVAAMLGEGDPVDCIAHALVAAEARGSGKRATYILQADLDAIVAQHETVTAGMLAEIKALTVQVETAEERGYERGKAAERALLLALATPKSTSQTAPLVVGEVAHSVTGEIMYQRIDRKTK